MPYKHKQDKAAQMRRYRQLQKAKDAHDQAELDALKEIFKERN